MAATSPIRLRRAWFQIHNWIGIMLAIAIIPLSLSGAALVWHDALDQAINPQRYATRSHPATLSPDAYAAAARARLAPGDRIASIRWPEAPGGPIIVSAAKAPQPGTAAMRGPPVRTQLWLDPSDGHVLDVAASNTGAVRFLHVLHGSLQIPGIGRQIVGWIGVAMLLSCLSGIWLWWPTIGRWTRGLRWRRQTTANANLHHQLGFWIVLPLAMLALTGVWISFPGFFASLTGSGSQGGPGGGAARFRAQPLEQTRLAPSAALAAAAAIGTGVPVSLNWPTDKQASWQVSFAGRDRPSTISVDDKTGVAAPAGGGGPQGGIARLMRRLHDGTGMGPVWQTIIFIAGIVPAILAVTGLIMWLRTRGWRAASTRRRNERRGLQPAE